MNEGWRGLWKERPRNRFLRGSLFVLAGLMGYAWVSGEIEVGNFWNVQRAQNVRRFVHEDIVPFPLRDRPFEARHLLGWVGEQWRQRGRAGLQATAAIAVLSIVLAGIGGAFLFLPAARNFMKPNPFLPTNGPEGPVRRLFLAAILYFTRFVQLFLRAIPEYVWAFLLLAMIGPTAWPAVIALALHNAGILGKLTAEVVENLEPGTLRSLRVLGARRGQIAGMAIFPMAFPRFLLYFFYRFETCVREATVLGMLGIVSLGYWIAEARGRQYYDEMLFLVALGGGIVLAADVLSAVARRFIRRAV